MFFLNVIWFKLIMTLPDSPCSDNEPSLLCTATASDALGPPLPIELDVLLLLRRKKTKQQLRCLTLVFKLFPHLLEQQLQGFSRASSLKFKDPTRHSFIFIKGTSRSYKALSVDGSLWTSLSPCCSVCHQVWYSAEKWRSDYDTKGVRLPLQNRDRHMVTARW